MNKREIRARLVDAIGGGLCPKHGEYIGTGKHHLRACPYCDIEEFYNEQKTQSETMKPQDIKLLRLKLGLTQEQLAHKLGVSFTTVSRWETGRRKPSPLARQALRSL